MDIIVFESSDRVEINFLLPFQGRSGFELKPFGNWHILWSLEVCKP